MGVLAKGTVADRPWGMTLGALGLRGLSGQLTLTAEGKQYQIAFDQGAVVGAYSPLVNDAAVRLALTGNLITSSQVNDITRQIAAQPQRDEVELLAQAIRLAPDQARVLRRRLVAQRAARTFGIPRGEFVVEDRITIAVVPGSELDVRAIIYLGAKTNLTEERLDAELDNLGVWFKLKPDKVEDLAQYGFSAAEKPVLEMLVAGANIADIEAVNGELGLRTVRAVTYSLAACGALEMSPTSKGTPARRKTGEVTPPVTGRAHSTTMPPQTTFRTSPPSSPPPQAQTPQHKTAPLGSRTPSASSPPNNEAPSGPRTITESTGVPRTTTSGTGSAGVRFDRSPSGGVSRPQDRSPSGGVARPNDRRSPSGGVPRPEDSGAQGSGSGSIHRPNEGSGAWPIRQPDRASSQMPAVGRTQSPSSSGQFTLPQNAGASGSLPAVGRSHTPSSSPPNVPRSHTPSSSPPLPRTSTATGSHSSLRSPAPDPLNPPTARGTLKPRRPKQSTASTLEVEALLDKKLPLIEQNADHYTLLGLPMGASTDDVRNTYFLLARKLHPDRLAAIGIDDEDRKAQRVMARINEAFAVLNDFTRRNEYLALLQRGGEAVVQAEEAKADELAMRVMRAEEAFKQGEMALRREQLQQAMQAFATAVELQPNEPEYQALLAWAQFANAKDKNAIASATRKALIKAAGLSDESPTARFYLGRVERMLGREKEALVYFHEVLRIKPNHSEAASEARVLEQRLKGRR